MSWFFINNLQGILNKKYKALPTTRSKNNLTKIGFGRSMFLINFTVNRVCP